MDGSCSNCEVQSLINELKAVSSVAGAPRKGFWKVSQAEDIDEGSCGQSTFALDVVDLPAGWGKVSYYGDVVTAGRTMWAGSTPFGNFHFALTIPQDAANGTYDMCVLVYNRVSGLQTAKPFRVTLPESGWQFWTNGRPGQYSPAPANNCSQYVTCRTGIAGCTAPIAKQGICEREAQADEPGCSPRSAATVTVTLVAAGSVSDYNETTKTNLQIKFAQAARVPPSFVVVQVAAGSVIITAVIAVPVGSTASGITNALATTLGSTSAASSFLGITVTSAPTFTTNDNIPNTGNSLALPLGLGLGLGLGGCLVLSALYVLIKRREGKVPAAKPPMPPMIQAPTNKPMTKPYKV